MQNQQVAESVYALSETFLYVFGCNPAEAEPKLEVCNAKLNAHF